MAVRHTCDCGKEWECPFCETKEAYLCPTLDESDAIRADCPDCITDAIDDMEAAIDGDIDFLEDDGS